METWKEKRKLSSECQKVFSPFAVELSEVEKSYKKPTPTTKDLLTHSQVSRYPSSTSGYHFKSRYLQEPSAEPDKSLFRYQQSGELRCGEVQRKVYQKIEKPKAGFLSSGNTWSVISETHIWPKL